MTIHVIAAILPFIYRGLLPGLYGLRCSPMDTNGTPIIFFPALGCDARLGRRHHELPFPIRWARWLPVRHVDDLPSYAERVAATVEIPEDCYLAGTSLGGLIALHLARRIKPRGVILIGSMRSSAGVAPAMARLVNWVIRFAPEFFVNLDCVPRPIVERQFGISSDGHVGLLRSMVRRHRGSHLRKLCRLALSVDRMIDPGCPVLSIHGTKDRILNYFEDETDVPLHGAGHFISLTHADEVNEAILNFRKMVESGLWSEGLYHALLSTVTEKTA